MEHLIDDELAECQLSSFQQNMNAMTTKTRGSPVKVLSFFEFLSFINWLVCQWVFSPIFFHLISFFAIENGIFPILRDSLDFTGKNRTLWVDAYRSFRLLKCHGSKESPKKLLTPHWIRHSFRTFARTMPKHFCWSQQVRNRVDAYN